MVALVQTLPEATQQIFKEVVLDQQPTGIYFSSCVWDNHFHRSLNRGLSDSHVPAYLGNTGDSAVAKKRRG